MEANNFRMSSGSDEFEQRLRDDRRLLGRLLGEVIRDQAGPGMLEKIEFIRRAAVDFRRGEVPY